MNRDCTVTKFVHQERVVGMSQATKWHSVAVLLLLYIFPNTFDDNDDDRRTRTIN